MKRPSLGGIVYGAVFIGMYAVAWLYDHHRLKQTYQMVMGLFGKS